MAQNKQQQQRAQQQTQKPRGAQQTQNKQQEQQSAQQQQALRLNRNHESKAKGAAWRSPSFLGFDQPHPFALSVGLCGVENP